MSPPLRKLALTLHVITSVGWLGAVASFLVLAVAGLADLASQVSRAAYVAMSAIAWIAILPLALTALLSGLVASLGTRWGLFRYYWILVKLLVTPFATFVLVIHMKPIDRLAYAASTAPGWGDLRSLQWLMVTASSIAIAVLVGLTALSIFKPQGLTRYGVRKLQVLIKA